MVKVRPIPIELLNDSIKVKPFDSQKAKKDSWVVGSTADDFASYTVEHIRVEPATSLSVGGSAGTQMITGAYDLFVDAVNSTPLDTLPRINDKVTVQSTQQSLIVKSFDPIYDFGTHVHHWEGVLQ